MTDGYQEIVAINEVVVTITGHNNTAAYDGAEHSVSGYDVEISNPLYKEAYFSFSGTAEAKRTDAGTTNMGLTAKQFKNNNSNFKTVTFNVTDGYQTIDPISVTVKVTGHQGSSPYDGQIHITEGYDVEISNPLYKEKDFRFKGTAKAARSVVGTAPMNLKSSDFINNNSNFRDVVFTIVEDGSQTITTRPLMITTGGGTKEYDGTPLTNDAVTVEGLIAKDRADVTATGKQTEVGQSDNTYTIVWQDPEVAKNYTIKETLGKLIVKENTSLITLTAPSDSKTYDGTALTCDGTGEKKVTASGLPEGFTIEATASGSHTDAGSSENVVNDGYRILDQNKKDKTSNFTKVEKEDGTLTVGKATLTITTSDAEKAYDGEPLTAEGTITGSTQL